MKKIIIILFVGLTIANCSEVKCMKLGTAKQIKNSRGEICNSW
jgi:hypothetical protein